MYPFFVGTPSPRESLTVTPPNVVDRLDGASMAIFGVRAPSFSRPRLRPTRNFSRRSLCTSNSFRCTIHTGIVPFEDISHGCCREHRTSPSSAPERPPPQLSYFSSLLAIFFFPVLIIAAPFFARSCLQQISFGTRFRPSLLSPLHAELQESFCCPCFRLRCRLLDPRPRDLLSGRCCALVTLCASKKYLADTLLRGPFGSLHVLFLCVHSIFVFMTSHCPIYGVECAYTPCQGNRGECDYNGSRRKGFIMSSTCALGVTCPSHFLVIFKGKL